MAYVETAPSWRAPYFRVAVNAFRRFSTYRGATFAGVVTNTMFGFVYAFVFAAVHDQAGLIGGVDAASTMLYVFTAQAFLAMTGAFGDREISERVRTGDIAADLYRPVDFQMWWLSHDIGKSVFLAVFRGIPPFVIGWLILGFPLPTDPTVWLVFVLMAGLAVVLAFGVRYLANLSAFWFVEARGIVTMVVLAQVFLGGHVVPLYFMPDALQSVVRLLPFAGITALPAETLMGRHQGTDMVGVVGFQVVWIVVIFAGGRWMFSAAQRKLVVQGG